MSQVLTSYILQFPSYSPDKIFKLKATSARSIQSHTMMLHAYTPNECLYQVSTSYALQFLRYSPNKLFTAIYPTACPSRHHGLKQYPHKGCGVKSKTITALPDTLGQYPDRVYVLLPYLGVVYHMNDAKSKITITSLILTNKKLNT